MTATFSHLLASCVPRVHRCALGWLGDEQEAREVAQEAITRAWSARDRYDPKRPFYPWLSTIVRNACRDARARRRHRAVAGLESDQVKSAAPTPLDQLDSARAQQRLRSALEHLDDAHREIIVMRHFEDLSYAEMAQRLDVAQGTVMSRLFRARRALVQILEGGTR